MKLLESGKSYWIPPFLKSEVVLEMVFDMCQDYVVPPKFAEFSPLGEWKREN